MKYLLAGKVKLRSPVYAMRSLNQIQRVKCACLSGKTAKLAQSVIFK